MELSPAIEWFDDAVRPGWVNLVLSGPLTIKDVLPLHQTAVLLVSRDVNIAMSLERVTSLDGAALQLIVGLARTLAQKQLQCDLSGMSPVVQSVFAVAGLSQHR